MGVAKAGGDTAMKAKAALVVNGMFCRCVDHGGGKKVGGDGRAAVDNSQQRERQSSNNQLKVMVASSGIDSRGGGGEQQRSMAISSKTASRCGASLGGTLCYIINFILRLFLYHFLHTLSS